MTFQSPKRPNVVMVFADQWRAQATGYAGNPDVRTPYLDRLAKQSLNATHAISGCPVCSPARASLMTGQYPLTHGVFVNDVPLKPNGPTLGEVFGSAGYQTAYIGKWHLHSNHRTAYIPPQDRCGFAYWKVLECTHDYNHSAYYANDDSTMRYWEGYDAFAQTRDAQQYIEQAANDDDPFLMVLSWGPPHDPYGTAPQVFRDRYKPDQITLPPNVPDEMADQSREMLAGYYAHCTALDECVGMLLKTLESQGIADDTIFLFFSDHGDMLGSQGQRAKQKPWDESLRVPFLLRWPAKFGWVGRALPALIDIPDYLPTLASLCGIQPPTSCQGLDWSEHFKKSCNGVTFGGARVITCPHPFGQWWRGNGGRAYRGLRSARYTYVQTHDGPWLLYDNQEDPYQLNNLVDDPNFAELRTQLQSELTRQLDARGDTFADGMQYIQQWGYVLNELDTIPYVN